MPLGRVVRPTPALGELVQLGCGSTNNGVHRRIRIDREELRDDEVASHQISTSVVERVGRKMESHRVWSFARCGEIDAATLV